MIDNKGKRNNPLLKIFEVETSIWALRPPATTSFVIDKSSSEGRSIIRLGIRLSARNERMAFL